jgi:type II secretory pathway predicted ATPase ExeA
MIPPALSRSREAVGAAEGYSAYFATEAHYLSLAHRIVGALCTGGFVLVTGDPPAVPHRLSRAFRKAARSRHAVIDIVCHAELTSEELSRACCVVAALPPSGDATTELQRSESGLPILVFADADRLSDVRFREIVELAEHDSQRGGIAALLLARSSFVSRLEENSLQFLNKRLAARFEFQEISLDEGIEFLRHQLAARHPTPMPAISADQPPSSAEIEALVTRGGSFLSAGDIISARLFYERAADVGKASAALRLGATFDPGILDRAGIRGIRGDPAQAASWYRRARDLGDPGAAAPLKDLDEQRAGEPGSSRR